MAGAVAISPAKESQMFQVLVMATVSVSDHMCRVLLCPQRALLDGIQNQTSSLPHHRKPPQERPIQTRCSKGYILEAAKQCCGCAILQIEENV